MCSGVEVSADLTPVAFATGLIAGAQSAYAGVALHALTACKVRLWDNATTAAGTLLDSIELTAAGQGSFASFVLDPPVRVVNGIFVELVTGTVEGSIRLG